MPLARSEMIAHSPPKSFAQNENSKNPRWDLGVFVVSRDVGILTDLLFHHEHSSEGAFACLTQTSCHEGPTLVSARSWKLVAVSCSGYRYPNPTLPSKLYLGPVAQNWSIFVDFHFHNIMHRSFFLLLACLCGLLSLRLAGRAGISSSSTSGDILLSLRMICLQRSWKTSSTFAWNVQWVYHEACRQKRGLTTSSCRSLIVWSIAPILGHVKCIRPGNNSFHFKVGFIAYNNNRCVLVIFDANDLLAQTRYLVEAIATRDGED